MRSTLSLLVAVMLVAAAGQARAQDTGLAGSPAGEFRVDDVAHVTPTGPGQLARTAGTLVSDAQRQHLAFLHRGNPFLIPFSRITALHYEESKYPKRSFWRSNHYLAIHRTDENDEPAVSVIRFQSREDALAALDALRRDTGLVIDREPAPRSLLGMPIHAAVGAKVVVTDVSGQSVKGSIATLSPTALEIADLAGERRRFDQTNLRSVRWQYSATPDATRGFIGGSLSGVLSVWLVAALGGCFEEGQDCHVVPAMALVGGAAGGVGAAASAALGAARYPFNGAYDVYRSPTRSPARRDGLAVMPQVSPERSVILVSVGF